MPLIQNKSGQIAGQILVPQENQHRFITGKSGSGKTVFLIQLMYHLSKAENRIIVFDSSYSFTEDSLLKVLPQNFVRENITFHKIDEKGIPVYLLHTYSTDKPLSRRNMLFNILCEAIHDPSQNQEIALKKSWRFMQFISRNIIFFINSCPNIRKITISLQFPDSLLRSYRTDI
ncbi:MAG: type IV secretion system DNA-binding domain-containing protein [Ruminococcus sp.]|nr:type IV secretion system DNA-binding domain-containing protein [Ruminococcus sp.]